jgi:hypothetical protein
MSKRNDGWMAGRMVKDAKAKLAKAKALPVSDPFRKAEIARWESKLSALQFAAASYRD